MKHLAPLAALLAAVLSGCGSIPFVSPPKPAGPLDGIELYLSRASFSGTEYEQYKLTGARLFHECGLIKGGRQVTIEQDMKNVAPSARADLSTQASKVYEVYADDEPQVAEPGTSTTFIDPGQFFVTMTSGGTRTEVRTSLDSVSVPSSAFERTLKDLTTQLRKEAGQKLCGNARFFGL